MKYFKAFKKNIFFLDDVLFVNGRVLEAILASWIDTIGNLVPSSPSALNAAKCWR